MIRKIVIVPDSFKGTMSSIEVCNIVERGIKNIKPSVEIVKIPIADGGEGTVDAFLNAVGGEKVCVEVFDPLFRKVKSQYGILPDGNTAVIEMAAASGLLLVDEGNNPCKTTTFGTGQLILDALDHECRKIIIGIGGSATNDGGIGMAAALGVKFLDKNSCEIPLNGDGLALLDNIDITLMDKRLKECEIIVACDVNNPLYGPQGAACVFGPQKGADKAMVEYLDMNLRHYSDVIFREMGMDVQSIHGAGAAGGLGAGLVAFAGARLESGIEIILNLVDFDDILVGADLVITGEGRIDGQSVRGKVPVGVASRAKKHNVPVIALVGDIGNCIGELYDLGITAVFNINRKLCTYESAKIYCKEYLLETTEALFRFACSVCKGS